MRFFEKFVKPYKNLGEEQLLYALFIMNYEVCFFHSPTYICRERGSVKGISTKIVSWLCISGAEDCQTLTVSIICDFSFKVNSL